MNAVGHAWSISSPPAVFSITRATQIALIPPYSFMLTEDNGTSINSTLSLTVFADFDGAAITCRDANALPEDAAKQTATGMVFGELSYNVTVSTGFEFECTILCAH